MCILPRDPAASARTPRTVSQAAPVTPANMEAPAILSASLLTILVAALRRSGAATVSSTQPPPAPLLPPVRVSTALTRLGTASVMRPATVTPASGMEVTVPSLWRTPGPTAPPRSAAGSTSTTSVMSSATLQSACLTTSNARGTARPASMTNTVQTTSKTTTVIRDATVRSVAGMGWTVLPTSLRTWRRAPWSSWFSCPLSSCCRILEAS